MGLAGNGPDMRTDKIIGNRDLGTATHIIPHTRCGHGPHPPNHTHNSLWNSHFAVGLPLLTCRGVASLLQGCPGVAVATDLPAGSALCTVHRHLGSHLQHSGDHMEERRGLWDNIQQSYDTPSPTPLSCDTLCGHVTYTAPPLHHVSLSPTPSQWECPAHPAHLSHLRAASINLS